MKKLFFLFALLWGLAQTGAAQNYNEAVYLKNGSVIRGTVIEQVPSKSIKIQTSDGSIYAYPMQEVEKITKEFSSARTHRPVAPNKTLKGYKGFVETGYLFDVSDCNANRFELSTTHGYQFNNYLFVGGGVGIHYYNDADATSVPVYAAFRANFKNKKITPFADARLGYSSGDVDGAFLSLGVGARFALVKKLAINVKLEYVYQESEYYDYRYDYWCDDSESINAFGLKVGFEF